MHNKRTRPIARGMMHHPKSGKRSTFSHKVGQNGVLVGGLMEGSFKKSTPWVQKVHFLGGPAPPQNQSWLRAWRGLFCAQSNNIYNLLFFSLHIPFHLSNKTICYFTIFQVIVLWLLYIIPRHDGLNCWWYQIFKLFHKFTKIWISLSLGDSAGRIYSNEYKQDKYWCSGSWDSLLCVENFLSKFNFWCEFLTL